MRTNYSLVSKIFLAVTIVILIGNAYFISRDYQDSWILEGLEIPFIFFVITFAAAFFFEKSISGRVAIAVIGRAVFTLIPAVKYTWFLGPFIDQYQQFSLAQTVSSTGHIAAFSSTTSGLLGYIETPLQHLSYSMYSLLLGITIVNSMKFLPVFWAMLFPLFIYIVVKSMHFPEESTLLGYALFISAIPISMGTQYIALGSLFGTLLVEFVLILIVITFSKKNRLYLALLFFSALALALSHSLTSVLLAGSLVIVLFLARFTRLKRSFSMSVFSILTIALIALAWLAFQAFSNLQAIIDIFVVEVPTGTTPVTESIPPSFFSVLRTNPLAAARVFVVLYGADVFLLILTIVGLFIMLRTQKRLSPVSKFLVIFSSVILVLMVVGSVIQAGTFRLLNFAELLYPIFSAIFLLRLGNKTRFRRIMVGLVLVSIIILCTIQFYGYQPLVPSDNILYPQLPQNVPMTQVGLVNTIYQRQMIVFIGEYGSGKVVTINPTVAQILGLTNESYWISHVYYYNPMDESQPKQQFDYFLINMPGQSGIILTGNSTLRNPNLIASYISNSTIIYSNGGSFIIKSPPTMPP